MGLLPLSVHFGIETGGSFWSNLSFRIAAIATIPSARTQSWNQHPMAHAARCEAGAASEFLKEGGSVTELPSPDCTRGQAYRPLVDRVPG